MHAKNLAVNTQSYSHRLDATKEPKQIDITVKRVNGPTIGIIKGIYVLEGDELRLCLAAIDKDRPAAFPEKPGPGEVLVLRREKFDRQQPAKTDQERMVGEWLIKNADSKRQGELWVIHKDHILMNYYGPGILARQYHFLDAGKDPKQIDITFTQTNGPNATKGIYVLDGDELRLCLATPGKDRPAAFPVNPKPGEVVILHRQKPGTEQPKAKGEAPDAKKVLTPEEAIKLMPKENVTVQFKVASVEWDLTHVYSGYPGSAYTHLKDGGKFSASLISNTFVRWDADQFKKKLGIETHEDFKGKMLRVTGRVEHFGDTFRMYVRDLKNIEVVKPKTGGKEQPNDQKQPLTKEEKLRALIDQVLAAHGGEEKLNKLTSFTMTVKHSNGETQHYYVRPPKDFRWETTGGGQVGKRIVILFPEGRRWWRQEPNEDAKEFRPSGAERRIEFWHDYVKFFGPRQVLRLKDAEHKVALLDEEVKIDGRAAVGVQVIGPQYNHKVYFDKETHLLVKGIASDIVREVTFSDYKKFDGIPIAQKEHDGHFDPVITDFGVVDKFDAKLFDQP
jgi:uncharacterized protein (TIGR03067 family)